MKKRSKVKHTPSGLKKGKVRKAMMTKSAFVPPLMISPEEMTPEKRAALEAAGWKVGSADEFLDATFGKSNEETAQKKEEA
jgi:hypothetical protein